MTMLVKGNDNSVDFEVLDGVWFVLEDDGLVAYIVDFSFLLFLSSSVLLSSRTGLVETHGDCIGLEAG